MVAGELRHWRSHAAVQSAGPPSSLVSTVRKTPTNLRALSAQRRIGNSDSSTSNAIGWDMRCQENASDPSGFAGQHCATRRLAKRPEIYTSHYRRCGQETNSIPVRLHAMPASHSIFRKNCAIHTGTIEYQLIRGGLPNSK